MRKTNSRFENMYLQTTSLANLEATMGATYRLASSILSVAIGWLQMLETIGNINDEEQ